MPNVSDRLLIHGVLGTLWVNDYQNGELGIELVDAVEPQMPDAALTIVGDLAWFSRRKDGIQVVGYSMGSEPIVMIQQLEWMGSNPSAVGTYAHFDSLNNPIQVAGSNVVLNDFLYGSQGNDLILPGGGMDIVQALGGDDVVQAGAGNDFVDGGAGADVIEGNAGSDILAGGRFGEDGNDFIYGDAKIATAAAIENGNSDSGTGQQGDWLAGYLGDDTLVAGADNDVLTGGKGNDTLIGGAGDDDIMGDSEWQPNYFSWGVTTSAQTGPFYVNYAPNVNRVFGSTIGGTYDTGDGGADIIFAGAGNDFVDGGRGDDVIYGESGKDHVLGGEGNDLILLGDGDDYVRGGNGDDIVFGDAGIDTLDGGTGNDTLYGGAGGDVYLFNLGDGQDTIYDDSADGSDTLSFGAGISASDIVLARNGTDLIVSINGTADRITIQSWGENSVYQVENFAFTDGTRWDLASINARIAATPFSGTEANNTLSAWAGVSGTLLGFGGNDTLYGGTGNETLGGGTGNDTLHGGEGNDVYLFNLGDGQDTVSDNSQGGFDTISFGAGITEDDVVLASSGKDLIVRINGTTDQIVIKGWGDSSASQIEQFVFADGATWDRANVNTSLATTPFVGTEGDDELYGWAGVNGTLLGLAGDDTIHGSAGNETLVGDTGNDTLYGGGGNDLYLFNLADGQDTILDNSSGGSDTISFGAGINGNDVVLTSSGTDLIVGINGTQDQITIQGWGDTSAHQIEQIVFADGTTWDAASVNAGIASTPFVGTEGNDSLSGWAGVDGSLLGLGGDDTIAGKAGDETLVGGAGNDTLHGGGGNDLYRFNLGDGQDTIFDSSSDGSDTLSFGAGITANDIVLDGSGADLIIGINGTADQIRIQAWGASPSYQIEQFLFADGTSLDAASFTANLRKASVVGTAGNDTLYGWVAVDGTLSGLGGDDTIYGAYGNETLVGGAGNDTMHGGSGNDVYLFNLGDGQDAIVEFDNKAGNVDTLRFGEGIVAGDVTVIASGADRILSINGTSDQITIKNWEDGSANYIERVEFADGTAWEIDRSTPYWMRNNSFLEPLPHYSDAGAKPDLLPGGSQDWDTHIIGDGGDDLLYGTAGNDYVQGYTGDDELHGYSGMDFLISRSGNDTFYGGDDDDTIWGGYGNDLIFGGSGSDDIRAGAFETNDWGNNTVYGDEGNDYIIGAGGNDTLYGGFGNDSISGGWGDDTLFGGAGNDGLVGGFGNNIVYGGTGDDWIQLGLIGSTGTGVSTSPTYNTVYGEEGNDLYGVYSSSLLFTPDTYGEGIFDTIIDYDTSPGNVDTLEFYYGYAPEDVTVEISGVDRVLTMVHAGGGIHQITIKNWDISSAYHIERVVFYDGTVWDEANLQDPDTIEINVAPVVSATIADQAASEDALFSFALPEGTFTDANVDDTLSYTATLADGSALPAWLSFDAASQTFIGTPTNDDVGAIEVKVSATDELNRSVSDTFVINVANTNDAPTVVNLITNQSATEGALFSFTVSEATFADIDVGDMLSYSARLSNGMPLPSWLKFDGATKTFTGSPAGSDVGVLEIEVIAGDIAGASVSDAFSLSVSALNTIVGTDSRETINGTVEGDKILGNGGVDTIYGNAGHDILVGGIGNDKLYGGSGSDTYFMGRGDGQDVVYDYDANDANPAVYGETVDSVKFDAGIAIDQLWFATDRSNLVVSIIGTEDKVAISNWYKGADNQVDQFVAADGSYLVASQVEQLVQAMAAFNPPALGETNLSPELEQQLQPVISASWQSAA